MPEIIFHHPSMSLLLLLVPVFVVVFRLRLKRQRRDMELFGVGARMRRTSHVSMESWRLGLLVGATILIILALTRPAMNPHAKMIPREGRDVVFLLDVSKSMLAEDRLPHRLGSAKASIAECVNALDDHRVGLVVFAGSSSIICPLTMDTDFFLNSLEKAGPDSVAHGGTRIGDALLKVCDKLFSDNDQGYKDIVLISDGGDQSEGVAKAIEEMNQKQVRLIAIGLGDPNQGARIPMQVSPENKSDYLLYKNQVVWSKLDGAHLSEMVKQCHQGAYLPVGTRQMHLDQIYHRLSEQGGTQQLAEESVIAYDDIFQWFVALAFMLLVLMALVPHTRVRQLVNRSSVLLAITLTLCPQSDGADEFQNPQGLHQKGNTQYRAGEFTEAVTSYEMALRQQPSGRLIRDVTYNLGNAYFKASKKAETSYESLSLVNQSVAMYRRVLLQNRSDHDAAVNNELARVERRSLEVAIQEDEKRRQEMQVALNQIREQLVELLTQQRKILPRVEKSEKKNKEDDQVHESEKWAPDNWGEDEQRIADGTDRVATSINALNEKFFKGVLRDFTPVAETQKHVATAFLNQNQSILVYQSQWEDALAKGRASLQSLQDALATLPQEPDDESQSSDESSDNEEGDDSESGDDGDSSEGEEGEGEEGEEGEMESSDATKMDLESIELPPPSNSPEDVIRMSQEMQNARQAAEGKKKGKPVEKDW